MKKDLVWSSKPVRETTEPDGRRAVSVVPHPSVQRFQAKYQKYTELKEAALAAKKVERMAAHEQRVIEDQQRSRERKKAVAETQINKRFGDAIVNKREALGLTQEQLAEVLAFDLPFLAGLEAGSHGPYLDTALRISCVLQIKIDSLADLVNLEDVEPQRRRLAAAVEAKAKEVETEMVALQKQMDALKDKKTLIARVRSGAAGLPF